MLDRNIVFEKLPNEREYGIWEPKLPEHNGGSQHENAGMDFFSATRVVAEEVGISSRLPSGYFEITGGDLTAGDISFIHSQVVGETTSLVASLQEKNVRIDYSDTPPKPLRMYQAVIPTGLRVGLPDGYHLRVASRSGLGFRDNICAFPGTIDSSYRGPIMIKLIQFTSNESPFVIEAGAKVAQGIVFVSYDYQIREGVVSEETSRGAKGFGSSG